MAGLLLDRGVRCVPSYRRETTVLSTFGSPGAEVAAGDLREIADVEPGAGNNRVVGTATGSGFLNSDAPLAGSCRRVVSARGEWVAGACGLLPGLPAVPLGSSCEKCSQGTRRRHASPLARHNRAICTQTTEPAIKANTGEYSAARRRSVPPR